APRPVAAAGGIADARGVVAVLALGAQAAVLGTRFLASAESRAHPRYKQKVLQAGEGDTVRTTLFGHGWPDAPHRALRTAFVEQWLGQEARGQGARPDEPAVGQTVIGRQALPVLRFMGLPPNGEASGGLGSLALLARRVATSIRWICWRARASAWSARSSRPVKSFTSWSRRRGRSSRSACSAWYSQREPAGRIPRAGSHCCIPLSERPSRAAEGPHV